MLNKLLEIKYKNRKYLKNGLFVDKLEDLCLDDYFYIWFNCLRYHFQYKNSEYKHSEYKHSVYIEIENENY